MARMPRKTAISQQQSRTALLRSVVQMAARIDPGDRQLKAKVESLKRKAVEVLGETEDQRITGADWFARKMKRAIEQARLEGCDTNASVTRFLNKRGIRTNRGNAWSNVTVGLLLKRIARIEKDRGGAL